MSDDMAQIEKDFTDSWEGMEQFFHSHRQFDGWEFLIPMESLVAEMIENGYDKKLRAGQSLVSFIVSRARQHGLSREHSYLRIEARFDGGMDVILNINSAISNHEFDKIELNDRLIELLDKLVALPIDG